MQKEDVELVGRKDWKQSDRFSRVQGRKDFLSCISKRINPKALGKSVETAELLIKGDPAVNQNGGEQQQCLDLHNRGPEKTNVQKSLQKATFL